MAGGVEPYLVGEAAGGADGESVVVLGLFADEDGCGGEGVGAERLRRARRAKRVAKERGVRDVRDIVRVGSTCTFLTFLEGAWDFGPLTFLGPRGWGVVGRSSRPRKTAADTIDSSEEGGEEEECD